MIAEDDQPMLPPSILHRSTWKSKNRFKHHWNILPIPDIASCCHVELLTEIMVLLEQVPERRLEFLWNLMYLKFNLWSSISQSLLSSSVWDEHPVDESPLSRSQRPNLVPTSPICRGDKRRSPHCGCPCFECTWRD